MIKFEDPWHWKGDSGPSPRMTVAESVKYAVDKADHRSPGSGIVELTNIVGFLASLLTEEQQVKLAEHLGFMSPE